MCRIALLVCCLSVVASPVCAQDKCRDILADGIRDTFKAKRLESVDQTIRKYLFMSVEEAKQEKNRMSHSAGGAIDIPILDSIIGAGGDWEKMKASEKIEYVHKALETDFESRLKKKEEIENFSSVASEIVANKWSKCMDEYFILEMAKVLANGKGLLGESEVTDKLITVKLRFIGGEHPVTDITSARSDNAVPQAPVEGKINATGVEFIFERPDPHQLSWVSIQTKEGPYKVIVEGKPKDPVVKPVSVQKGRVDLSRQSLAWVKVTEDDRESFWRCYINVDFDKEFRSVPICGLESFNAYPEKGGAGKDPAGLVSVWTTNQRKYGMTLVVRVQYKGDASNLKVKWMAVGELAD